MQLHIVAYAETNAGKLRRSHFHPVANQSQARAYLRGYVDAFGRAVQRDHGGVVTDVVAFLDGTLFHCETTSVPQEQPRLFDLWGEAEA